MKKILFLLLLTSASYGQTTIANKLKVTNATKNNTATRVVVQDSITKEYHWVLKSTISGGSGSGTVTNVTGTDGISVALGTTTPVIGISSIAQSKVTGLVSDLANTVKLTGDQTISGAKNFASDLIANGVFLGRGGGNLNTNTAIGLNSGQLNTTGNLNTSVGVSAGQLNTSGSNNTNIGVSAGQNNLTGTNNTNLGVNAGQDNITGINNINIGVNSGQKNTQGNGNINLGPDAGRYFDTSTPLTNPSNSIFIGSGTKALADNGSNEIVIGYNVSGQGSNTTTIGSVLTANTKIYGNIVSPTITGTPTAPTATAGTNTTQIATTAFVLANAGGGDMVLASAQTNTGVKTFLDGTIGLRNAANTFTSYFTNTNTASRTYTLGNRDYTIAGTDETVLLTGNQTKAGTLTLSSNLVIGLATIGTIAGSGSGNTRFGNGSLNSNTTGINNTAYGQSTLSQNTTQNGSSAFGLQALVNAIGTSNTGIGHASLPNITGSNNTAIGYAAGQYVSGGGNLTSANNSVFVGYSSQALANSQSNQIVIGHDAIGAGTNTVTLGNTSIVKTVIRGVTAHTTSYTIATLPTGVQGDTAYVTDATAPTYLGVLIGGGSIKCPVFYNGTTWVSH
jgi:hypothetical protein